MVQVSADDTIIISLNKKAETSSDVIRLKHIATITPSCEEVENIVVSWSPGQNSERRISKLKVAQYLRNRFDFPIELKGEKYVNVKRNLDSTKVIDEENLKQLIFEQLFQKRPDLAEFEQSIDLVLGYQKLPYGNCNDIKIKLGNTNSQKISGSATIKFDKKFNKKLMFTLKGRIEKKILRAARFIKKGDRLLKEDFNEEWIEADLKKSNDSEINFDRKLEAKTNISYNTIINPKLFKHHFDIKAGKSFMLTSNSKRIHLEVPAKACENGNIGDIIKVKNTISGKIVSGIVKSEDLVCAVSVN